ncbi:hypothetical protein QFZ32_004159 [Streptomyces canus]|nr:hypothetical protein [Streptomyces canus]
MLGACFPAALQQFRRWTGGGQTPLDSASRGGTSQPAAYALIRKNVTGRHEEAPRGTNAHGLVMRRSRVRIPKAAPLETRSDALWPGLLPCAPDGWSARGPSRVAVPAPRPHSASGAVSRQKTGIQGLSVVALGGYEDRCDHHGEPETALYVLGGVGRRWVGDRLGPGPRAFRDISSSLRQVWCTRRRTAVIAGRCGCALYTAHSTQEAIVVNLDDCPYAPALGSDPAQGRRAHGHPRMNRLGACGAPTIT